jgi:DNA-binding transcriptional ArsR family regulator
MLERLQEGEMSIGELAAPFAMSLAGASKHVRVLESAELVSRRIPAARITAGWRRRASLKPRHG